MVSEDPEGRRSTAGSASAQSFIWLARRAAFLPGRRFRTPSPNSARMSVPQFSTLPPRFRVWRLTSACSSGNGGSMTFTPMPPPTPPALPGSSHSLHPHCRDWVTGSRTSWNAFSSGRLRFWIPAPTASRNLESGPNRPAVKFLPHQARFDGILPMTTRRHSGTQSSKRRPTSSRQICSRNPSSGHRKGLIRMQNSCDSCSKSSISGRPRRHWNS